MTFADQLQQLRNYGMKDVILDPGFGFGKTLEQNYALMDQLERLAILELPLLVGISRKSMIYRLLGVDPAEALNGTTALHMTALMKGAYILRVHDVKEAVECCRIYHAIKNQE
jgi:dihydropteroate synthase